MRKLLRFLLGSFIAISITAACGSGGGSDGDAEESPTECIVGTSKIGNCTL